MIGLTRPIDGWVAYQFDAAVSLLGRYIDGKLSQYDDKGNPKYQLEDLLAEGGVGKRRKYASPE